jgi:hypothetical protein
MVSDSPWTGGDFARNSVNGRQMAVHQACCLSLIGEEDRREMRNRRDVDLSLTIETCRTSSTVESGSCAKTERSYRSLNYFFLYDFKQFDLGSHT